MLGAERPASLCPVLLGASEPRSRWKLGASVYNLQTSSSQIEAFSAWLQLGYVHLPTHDLRSSQGNSRKVSRVYLPLLSQNIFDMGPFLGVLPDS